MQATRIAPRRYTAAREVRDGTRHPVRRPAGRRQRSPRAAAALAIMLAVALWAGGTWIAGCIGTAGALPPRSTPRSEWRADEVPYLYQTDPAWSDHPYAGGTVGENGCGPTCLAMAYVALTGRTDLDPAAMCDFSEREGFMTDGMTAWSLMTEGAAGLGLSSRELAADAGSVRAALGAGEVVICSMGPGDFTTTGHFIVLTGMTDDGKVAVRDPNSPERSAEPWDLGRVLGQCKNLWALSG